MTHASFNYPYAVSFMVYFDDISILRCTAYLNASDKVDPFFNAWIIASVMPPFVAILDIYNSLSTAERF
jgi:hypothetical protein